jgi:glycosyltransferase involved in cell wall biosynthesis
VTVHDLIYYLYPDQCPSKTAHYYARGMLRYAVNHARTVITVSHHSKHDLLTAFQIPSEAIRVILQAADDRCGCASQDTATRNQVLQSYGIEPPYILYVGKHHPYKNIKTLLYAYAAHRDVFDRFQLVIAGRRDPRQHDLYETARRLEAGHRIRFTDFVPEQDVFALYQGAQLFVFPSLYEGFGLPPLEAMACGVPVITSNAASLPEVVGDAALQVPPTDVTALADAMRRVLSDHTLWMTLKQKGLKRAQQFSWETAAIQLLQVYLQHA